MITDAAGSRISTLCAIAYACTRATPEPTYIQYPLSLIAVLLSIFHIPSFFIPLHYLMPSFPCHFTTVWISILNSHSLLSHLIFRQPPSPLLSLVFFLIYNHSNLFILTTGIFGFSCRRVWAPPYLPYKSRHSDFFFCFIFFSGDFLFICRTRS